MTTDTPAAPAATATRQQVLALWQHAAQNPDPVNTLAGIVAYLAHVGAEPITEAEKAAVTGALATRGKCKGRLRASPPSYFGDNRLSAVAWDALQPNGYKVRFTGALYARDPACSSLHHKLSAVAWPSWLDLDCFNLKSAGVW
jgi:hypothetical protein